MIAPSKSPLRVVRGPYRMREVAYEADYRQAAHAHEEHGITLILNGEIRECVDRDQELGAALSVVVKPAGVQHANWVGPRGARTFQLLVEPGATDVMPAMQRWRWLHARPAASAMLGLLRIVRTDTNTREIEENICDVIAVLSNEPEATGRPPAWLREVREALDDSRGSYGLPELARMVGLHDVSLSRAFRRHYGCTFTDYRRMLRLRRAARAIEASEQSLSRIAHEAGYADHPHLSREFRAATGVSPSDFRAIARAG